MKASEVERWALEAVDRLMTRGNGEDGRVEFKRELPDDPRRVAQRIAGQANAAHSESILWVVGADEKKLEVVPGGLPDAEDPANYWPRVWSYFEGGVKPELLDIYVDYEGKSLLALGFVCDRPPYVVRTGVDSPALEVPWREGTRVVSATRSQLIRMMSPLANAPVVRVTKKRLEGDTLVVHFFVAPQGSGVTMLPLNRCVLEHGESRITAHIAGGNRENLGQQHPFIKDVPGQGTYFEGPGEVIVKWQVPAARPPQQCRARLTFEPSGIEMVITDKLPVR